MSHKIMKIMLATDINSSTVGFGEICRYGALENGGTSPAVANRNMGKTMTTIWMTSSQTIQVAAVILMSLNTPNFSAI